MRRQNHAAAVAGPAVHVERGIVGGEIGIAGVAEDALHKVEVRDQSAGDEVADLRALFGRDPWHRGTDERPQQQRDHGLHRLGPVRGERQAHEFGRRPERLLEQANISGERHAGFIRRNRKPALGHVKDALRGAAVVDRIVQDSIVEPVARHELVLPAVRVDRERQLPSQPVLVENEGLRGQAHGLGGRGVREELVDVILDSPVGGAEMVGEQPGLLAVAREEIARQVEHLLVAVVRRDPDAHGRELEQDQTDGSGSLRQPDRPIRIQSHNAFQLHACLPRVQEDNVPEAYWVFFCRSPRISENGLRHEC